MDLADTHMTLLIRRELSLCIAWTELYWLLCIEEACPVSLATKLPMVAHYWLTTLASLCTYSTCLHASTMVPHACMSISDSMM